MLWDAPGGVLGLYVRLWAALRGSLMPGEGVLSNFAALRGIYNFSEGFLQGCPAQRKLMGTSSRLVPWRSL